MSQVLGGIDLAREFGMCIGAVVELMVFESSSKSVEAVTAEQADFGFFAIDPVLAPASRP